MESPNITDIVFGGDEPALDDPAETWFEASKLARPTIWWDSMGVLKLESSPWLQEAATRGGKRYDQRPGVALAEAAPLDASLGHCLATRRSTDDYDRSTAVGDGVLAALLDAAYGTTTNLGRGYPRRAVPSGGALFPLDIHVVVGRADGLAPGHYHLDPLARRLARLGDVGPSEVASTTIGNPAVADAAVVVVVAASFWRSRFKYGQRALRFIHLEAGHVVQNLCLAATALGLAHRPIAGFYDDDLADLLGLDGVNEAPLYLVPIAHPTPEGMCP